MDLSPIPLPLLSFSWVFFISSTLILQMANTRNYNNNHNGDNNRENNQNVNLQAKEVACGAMQQQ
jgi:hypothetical protein